MDIRREDALSRACAMVKDSCDPFLAIQSVANMFENLLRYERYCVVLIRQSDFKPTIFAHSMQGIPIHQQKEEVIRVNGIISNQNTGVINHVIKSGDNLIVPDIFCCDFYAEGSHASKSEACVPLTVCGRTIGAFNVESRYRNFFGADDGLILQCVANQFALLIENKQVLQHFDGSHLTEMCMLGHSRGWIADAVGEL